jgi:hypothetical protein
MIIILGVICVQWFIKVITYFYMINILTTNKEIEFIHIIGLP